MKISTKYGIATGLLLSAVILFIQLFHYTQNKFVAFLIFIILIFGVITSCIAFNKSTNYTENFGKIFGNGFTTTVATTFITVASVLLSYLLIPNIKQTELQELQSKLSADTSIPENQKKEYYESQATHFYSLKSSQFLFPLLFTGSIFSLLGAFAISKKNKL